VLLLFARGAALARRHTECQWQAEAERASGSSSASTRCPPQHWA
jgi:hypothetical protein